MHPAIIAWQRPHRLGLLVMACLSMLLITSCGNATTKTPKPTTATPTATAHATAIPSTATAPPAATAVPASNGTLYTSSDGVFQFDYPSDWDKQTLPSSDTSSAVGVASPDGNEDLFVFPVTTPIAASDYPQVADSFLSQAISATNVGLDSATGTVTLPSGTWTTLDGGGTVNNTTYDFTQLAIDHGSGTFFIYVLTPATTASANVTNYFAPMLRSFKFLK